jgi:hypothetical protein
VLELLLDRTDRWSFARHGTAPLGHRARILQQPLTGQVGDLHRAFAGVRMIGGQHHDPGLGEQVAHLQSTPVDGQTHVTDVDPAVVDHLDLVVPAGADHLDVETGVAAGQLTYGPGNDQTGHEPDRKGVRPARDPRQPTTRGLGGGQEGASVGEKLLPGGGQRRGTPIT